LPPAVVQADDRRERVIEMMIHPFVLAAALMVTMVGCGGGQSEVAPPSTA
jgi:hypothetical protein